MYLHPPVDDERPKVPSSSRRNHRNHPPTPPRLLNTNDAAAYLSMGEWALRKLVREGKIRVIYGNHVRSPWRFDIKELDRYVEDSQFPKKRH